MRFRPHIALLLGAILSGCSLTPTAGPTPEASTNATSAAAAQPTAASAATTATQAPAAQPGATAQAGSATGSANYERSDCPFDVPEGQTIECGYLTVPENRAKDTGKTIRIAVGLFKSPSSSPKADPIVYLEGGPGGNALENWAENFQDIFGPFNQDRDFIIFDQRGTGYSEPSLACTEYTEEAYYQLDKQLSVTESNERARDALLKCHDRLAKEGVDFSAYNSVESAADLADLREALGYDEWNVYGISYGTRLALTAMREHPEGIRSVVIDSVVPLQSSETETPAAADRVFRTFFEGCAKDVECNTAYPNLEDTFYKLVDDLNAKPVEQQVTDPDDGKSYKVLLTGDTMIGALFFAMYQTSAIPLMPRAIASAADGSDYSLLARLVYFNTAQSKDFSIGMYYSVRCNEEVAFDTPEQLEKADDAFPQQRGYFDPAWYTPICNAWQAGKAPAVENQPVSSDIPTLVMGGEYDPVTPPQDSELASKTLSRSYFVEFPGFGHGVSIDGECAVGITQAFFDNPTSRPDDSCIADLKGPDFAVPEGPITLKPYEDTDTGVKGVVPEGWQKAGAGAYANSAGDAVILQFAAPRSRDEMLTLLQRQFSLTASPTPAGEHRSTRFTWSLYTLDLQGEPGSLGLAEDNGTTYVVLVASSESERQKLYDTLFIPALDALEPVK